MPDPRWRMEARLLWAALARRRGAVALAVLAVAIGASVAAALLHVSGDVGAQLSHELRVLGPNLVLVPRPDASGAAARWMDERAARARLDEAAVAGTPLLIGALSLAGVPAPFVGADLAPLLRLHPSWRLSGGDVPGPRAAASPPPSLVGARLARERGIRPGDHLALTRVGDPAIRMDVVAGPIVAAGGADDDALWIPLAAAQRLVGRPGEVSLVQARIEGGGDRLHAAIGRLERGGGIEALPLHALSSTEQGLLDRTRRLMALVTVVALVAGALGAYGTLTDLALERRREIALLKALGAPRRRIAGRLLAEALIVGFAGGIVGWAIGFCFAQLIGREVFHAAIEWRWEVPPIVVALALLTAAAASLGPIRIALGVEPARVLKGE